MEDWKEIVEELEEVLHKAKKMLKEGHMGQRGSNGYGYNSGGNSNMGNRSRYGNRDDWNDWGRSNYDPRFME